MESCLIWVHNKLNCWTQPSNTWLQPNPVTRETEKLFGGTELIQFLIFENLKGVWTKQIRAGGYVWDNTRGLGKGWFIYVNVFKILSSLCCTMQRKLSFFCLTYVLCVGGLGRGVLPWYDLPGWLRWLLSQTWHSDGEWMNMFSFCSGFIQPSLELSFFDLTFC